MRPVSWSSSYLLRDPLGISTTTWIGCSSGGVGLRPPGPPSVPDEAEELIAPDQLSALEKLEPDQGGARGVPPGASTSSTIRTRSPGTMASACSSRVAVSYSSAYSSASTWEGSLRSEE